VKTYASKFSAQRGARAAGHAVEAVRIEKTPKGFVWRLIAPQPIKPAPVAPESVHVAPAPVVPAPAAPAPAGASNSRRTHFAEIEATARAGVLPEPPDFSAATHARFRGKLARLADLAAAGDVDALRAFEINPVSSSPKAMARYRDLCVIALAARNA
jgi:hypothetical protein